MEKKINKLIDGVLDTQPTFWDNPNGGYVHTCPFCHESIEVRSSEPAGMSVIDHSEDCIYRLAQELHGELS